MNRIFLIDGHAQIFRMYYAFMRHPLINSKGIDTSILYGFTKMVLELIAKENPTHLAVAFDLHAETFRHKVYKEYKANRPPAPELVVDALEPLKEILKALNIPAIGIEGVEADDVIGSMAKQWSSESSKVYMVTPDKDYGQVVDDNIFQYKFSKGNSGEVEIIGKKELCSLYGICDPMSVIDILTIWGDASDNIPGVKGIGEVGAKKLIGEYQTLDNLLNHLKDLPAKQQEKIEAAREHLNMSRFLVTIKTDIDLPLSLDDIKISPANKEQVDAVFGKYEFSSLKKMIKEFKTEEAVNDFPADDYPTEGNYFNSYAPAQENKTEEAGMPKIKFVSKEIFESAVKKNSTLAMALPTDGEEIILCTADSDSTLKEPKGLALLIKPNECLSLVINPKIIKTGFSLKEIIRHISKSYTGNLDVAKILSEEELYDIQLLHYLINPEVSHSPAFIIKERFGLELSTENPEEKESDLFSSVERDLEKEAEERAKEALLSIYLKERLLKEIPKAELYRDIEMPLEGVLAKMELTGVKIDTAQLKEYSKELTQQMNEIEANAKALAEDPNINLSSPKQIGQLLFEKLKVSDSVKKSAKGSYPTDEQTLRSLYYAHPLIGEILEYRNLKKLLSTYIDAFPQLIDPEDGKIHTTFNQALTATGRLSSNNPNLQNIPIRTERGREIRKAFIPSTENGYIVSADYSQIELRLMAHLSRDEHLIAAFNSGQDVHKATAARLFGVDINDVTEDQRRKAKTVNFGIIYGISSFGLSERMEIGVKEAKRFIEQYFAMYPGVSAYIADSVEKARRLGYVETIYGRRRYLKDINSRNANVRKFNERNAVNAPLQGSAADIIKIAMVNVSRRLESENLKSRMVLQVHDELVFDATEDERDIVMQIAKEEMEAVANLKVKLTAECGYGKNWLQAH